MSYESEKLKSYVKRIAELEERLAVAESQEGFWKRDSHYLQKKLAEANAVIQIVNESIHDFKIVEEYLNQLTHEYSNPSAGEWHKK